MIAALMVDAVKVNMPTVQGFGFLCADRTNPMAIDIGDQLPYRRADDLYRCDAHLSLLMQKWIRAMPVTLAGTLKCVRVCDTGHRPPFSVDLYLGQTFAPKQLHDAID
jgi:hypothetical protein